VAKGELETPGLHDHLQTEAELLRQCNHPVHRGKVFEVEPVELRRLFTAAPGPGAPGLPAGVALWRVEWADGHPHAQQIHALAGASAHKAGHISATVGHAKKVIGGVPQDESRLPGLIGQSPPEAGRRSQKASRPGRLYMEICLPLQVGIGGTRLDAHGPLACERRTKAHAPHSASIVEAGHQILLSLGPAQPGIKNHITEWVGIGARASERPFCNGPDAVPLRNTDWTCHRHLPGAVRA